MWFDRAVRTHKLGPLMREGQNGAVPALAVVREPYLRAAGAPEAKRLFVIGQGDVAGWKSLERGQDYSVWQR
jgi:hypothetical protein